MARVQQKGFGVKGSNFLISANTPILADEIVEKPADLNNAQEVKFYPGKVVAVLNESFVEGKDTYPGITRHMCIAQVGPTKTTTQSSDWILLSNSNGSSDGSYRGIFDAKVGELNGNDVTGSAVDFDVSAYSVGDFFRINAYSLNEVDKYTTTIAKIEAARSAGTPDASGITPEDILDAGITSITLSEITNNIADIRTAIESYGSVISTSSDLATVVNSTNITGATNEIRINYDFNTGLRDQQLSHKSGSYIVIQNNSGGTAKIGQYVEFDSGPDPLYNFDQKQQFEARVKELSKASSIAQLNTSLNYKAGECVWRQITTPGGDEIYQIVYCKQNALGSTLPNDANTPFNSNWVVIASTGGSGSTLEASNATILGSDYSSNSLVGTLSLTEEKTYVPAKVIDARMDKLKTDLTITGIDGGVIT